ncbi:DUF6530 family protein [Endozoicomonas sp. ISHI1]|uniref:DUF6530 family protein n=1 Tax=Endozoicomonas sp. ISHI1 TaxID=2825882 RepID=UPI002149344F|nr:DUF6530 family protein [Endozoicomonas sp. ISHI1]
MKTPKHLKHKPIMEVANYDAIDGHRAKSTDAKCLSLGVAQWNGGLGTELSAKVWRMVDGRWSRQSEELPLNRVIDLATLICETKLHSDGKPLTSKGGFSVSKTESSALHDKILKIEFEKDNEFLDKSLKRLAKSLKALGY